MYSKCKYCGERLVSKVEKVLGYHFECDEAEEEVKVCA